MNCDHFEDAIGDLVDGARMDEARRVEVEAHLRECASCRDLKADLQRIRTAAGELPMAPVPRRVWTTVSARLSAEGARESRRPGLLQFLVGNWRLRLAWGGALALVVVLFLVVLPRLSPAPQQAAKAPAGPPVHANDAELVQSVESELQLAEQHYEKAIAGLEQIAKAGEGTLDPQIAATLQKNLGVVDQAIHDSRMALQAQPANEVAQESLFEAFRRKVSVLQETVSLINEMRKGNQAEAAKIIGNMNKS